MFMEKSATLFTLFAKEDEPFAEQLTAALSLLRRNGILHDYYDKEISPAETWDEPTRQHFTNSDYLVFLISPAFLASGYFQDPAIQQAVALAEQGQLKIINVLIRYCDFSKEPVSQFGMLPANGEPVESGRWGHPQNAWNAVMDGIKESITGEKPAAAATLSLAGNTRQAGARRGGMRWLVQLLLSVVAMGVMGGISYYLVNYEPPKSKEAVANIPQVPDTIYVGPAPDSSIVPAEPTAEDIANENKTLQNKKTIKAASPKRAVTKPAKDTVKVVPDTQEKQPEPPPPPKTQSIKSAELEQMLFSFSQGNIEESSFAPYLCNQLQTPVRFDKKSMTFQQMCAAIKKVKPKRIKKITVLSAAYDNSCISSLEVDLKKKGLLGLID